MSKTRVSTKNHEIKKKATEMLSVNFIRLSERSFHKPRSQQGLFS